MSRNRKVLSICFLVLTISSIVILSYSLYIILETYHALRSLEISLSNVSIEANGSEAYFHLVFCNPSLVQLEIYFLGTRIYFDGDYVGLKEISFYLEPLPLPTSVETNLTMTLPLNNQTSYLDGVWKIVIITLTLETPLPERGGYLPTENGGYKTLLWED